jgi:hypothetical protein
MNINLKSIEYWKKKSRKMRFKIKMKLFGIFIKTTQHANFEIF